jgi:hypothetical protein
MSHATRAGLLLAALALLCPSNAVRAEGEGDPPPVSANPIEGTVVDTEGQPLEGIEVRAYPDARTSGRPAWSWAKTDAKGAFRIADVREESHRVQAVKDGFRPFGPTWSSAPASEPLPDVRPGKRDLRLVLLPPGSVAGTLAPAIQGATPAGPAPRGIALYLVPAAESGTARPWGALGGTVAVPCRVDGTRLVADTPREGVRPTKVVVWEKGDNREKEVAGALDDVPYSFRLRDDQVEVDDEGRFRAEGIRQGRWRVEVDDIRALPCAVEFDVRTGRETKVDLPVRRRGWLTVRVRGADDALLQGATVVVLSAKDEVVPVLVETVVLARHGGLHSGDTLHELFRAITTTDREGRTRPRFLDPGSYRVRVMAEGRRPFAAELEVAEGKVSELDVRLDRER